MEDNKNQELSLDELLAKLKASLVEEESASAETEKKEEAPSAEETPAEAEAPMEEIEEPEAAEPAEAIEETEEVAEPAEEVEETEAVEETEEDEASEVAAEEAPMPAVGTINEEDIFKAWGIDPADIDQQKTEMFEAVRASEPAPEAAAVVTAATRVYRIARIENKEDFALRKQTEAQKESVDYDRTDYSLIKQALGMERPAESASDSQEFYAMEPKAEEALPKTLDAPHTEFTYQRQKEDISAEYKKSSRMSGIKLIAAAVSAVVLFLLECLPALGVTMPDAFSAEYYPVVYAMTTMQLAWIAAALCYREIANGFFGLLRFRLTSGSILGILVLATTVCDIIACTLGMTTFVFNFSVAFSALLVRAFEYFDIRREVMAFDIASSTQAKKHVAVRVQPERIAGLEEYSGEDSLVLRTEKCSFVENYFSRTEKRSDGDVAANRYIVPVILFMAILAAIISAARGSSAAVSTAAFNSVLALGMPVLILLSASFPLYRAAHKLARLDSAIIGETAVEEYAGTTMICFDDADAFPSYGVALENLRIYGKGDIETIIEQMDAVFSKLGGPLRHVFSLMISECPKPYKVKIEGVHEEGITAVVDGSRLLVGNAAYMEANGIAVLDKTTEIGGKRFSTMFLAEEGSLRAKFFIRYTLDGSFEGIVKKLARRGIASVILTGDANINDALLARSLDISRLPVKVVRRDPAEGVSRSDRADSGIVSTGAIGDLVTTVTTCDRLAGVIGTMRAVRIASAVICAILAIGAVLLGMHGSVSSLYVLLYHLFWLIPAWLVMQFNL